MRYELEAQKNILKNTFKKLCAEYQLESAIALIVKNILLLFKAHPRAVERRRLISELIRHKDFILKDSETCPIYIKTLYALLERDSKFITSCLVIDCGDKTGKARKKFIKSFLESVRSITFCHLADLSIQLDDEKRALLRNNLLAEKNSSKTKKLDVLAEGVEEEEEAVDENKKENIKLTK
jgi:hypothetical protein